MKTILRWFRKPADEALRDEIEEHLAQRAEHDGITLEEARRRFGNPLKIQEDVREVWLGKHAEAWLQDLRLTVRGLRRHPVFALGAVTALALSLGASTAVFSVVDRVLFRPLPFAGSDRLVVVGQSAVIEPAPFLLWPDYSDWQKSQTAFTSMTALAAGTYDCDLNEQNPLRIRCAGVAWNFLPVLGMAPQHGRDFLPSEDRRGAPRVALITDELWGSRFGRDRAALERTVSIDGLPTRIVGVLPANFEMPGLQAADVLMPMALPPPARPMMGGVLRVYARLKPGVTLEEARERLRGPFQEALQYVPAQFRNEVRLSVISLREARTGDARRASWLLLAAVVLMLLIACANVSNLLLARAASREREMAVRAALGAARGRIVRLVLLESLTLALLAGAAGLGLAWLLIRAFVSLSPASLPQLASASLDWRVFAFGFALSVVAGLLCGLAGAASAPRVEQLHGVRATGPRGLRLRETLLAGQVAVTLLLVAGASWLVAGFYQLTHQDLGFDASRVFTASVVLPQARYPTPAAQEAMWNSMIERCERIPGVEAAALADSLPPAGRTRTMIFQRILLDGQPPKVSGTGGMVPWRAVTPGYFETLGIPILRGRGFTEEDRSGPPLVILSASLERRLAGSQSAVGRVLRTGAQTVDYRVAGIAADVRNAGLALPADPEYYVLRRGSAPEVMRHSTLIVRAAAGSPLSSETLRREIQSLDATLPVNVQPMETRIGEIAARPRLLAVLLSVFAMAALLLASIGLAGVVAYQVSQRRREIGLRLALGATPGQARGFVIRRIAYPVALGLLAGGALALGALDYASPLLHGIAAHPWLLFAVAALACAALLAAWIPSREAARLDPQEALRSE